MIKIPRLNSKVYVLTFDKFGVPLCITKDLVFAKNKKCFITEDMLSYGVIDEYRQKCYFTSYGQTWFSSIKEAKEYVKKWFEDTIYNYEIAKGVDNCWTIESWFKRGDE